MLGVDVALLPQPNEDIEDEMLWEHSSNGGLTVTSAHEAIRAKGNKPFWASVLWNAILHPRTAAIGWKIFRGTMHTDDKLQSMKFKLASRCITCKQQCETQQHLLYECEFAKKCWNYVTTTFQLH
ncbi:hypothetical protein IFM89_002026 [Coptis chinensis]|uniref:Reverse transcriptase zinc-binding domain-containing protein n=1 Tax=Coptis chinensis TaxID=261450 RepID=A0A835HJ75_9MAGN|nr:hypothetical protein IFM89_002026 [Coptis chinensis]